MGWAGPAQPTGPDSAQNCWAEFGPKWIGPISAQNKYSSGPDPAQKTGLVRPNQLGRTQSKIVGPISAQNGLGRSRPKTNTLLGQTRPRRQGWARIRLAQ